MKISLRALMLLCACLMCAGIYASKPIIKKVTGKYTYVVSDDDDITLKKARQKAVELAKAEAIRREFGEMVGMGTIDIFMNSADGQSGSLNVGSSSTQARALWLGDTKQPQVKISYSDGKLFFEAEVWGEAREVVANSTDVRWTIARKSDNGKVATDVFSSGEMIYVDFLSVANGYVAVYLVEDENTTYCMLPYRNDSDGQVPVRAGREYAFFDKDADNAAPRLRLTTKKPFEYNQLVLIYSPNPFTKSVDKAQGREQLNSLSTTDFSKWLLRLQRNDPDMVVQQRFVKIQNPDAAKE